MHFFNDLVGEKKNGQIMDIMSLQPYTNVYVLNWHTHTHTQMLRQSYYNNLKVKGFCQESSSIG